MRESDGTTQVVTARNVAISTGLVPRLPEGMPADERVWHSSEFLGRFDAQAPEDLKSVAVVGAGQSAAEITRFLYDRCRTPRCPRSSRRTATPSPTTPPSPTRSSIPARSTSTSSAPSGPRTRSGAITATPTTRWSTPTSSGPCTERSYDEQVRDSKRLHFRNLTRVTEVKPAGSGKRVVLRSLLDDRTEELAVDALVFATGYDGVDPARLLGDLLTGTSSATRRAGTGWSATTVSSPRRDCPAGSISRAAPSTPRPVVGPAVEHRGTQR